VKPAGQLYALEEPKAADPANVITGTFPVNSIPAYVLFDSGASHSFVSSACVSRLGFTAIDCVTVDHQFSQPSGSVVSCNRLYKEVPLDFLGTCLPVDLVEFPLERFDVILGMDWLNRYKAKLDCELNKVNLRSPKGVRFF
jgi:Retroviral aspartyl protease